MRRILMAVSLVAMLTFTTVPALAADREDNWNDRWDDRQEERIFDGFFFFDDDDFDRFDDRFFFDGFDGDDFLNQDFDQDAESGDVDQSFDVSGTGDNSNQTVGTQGVANTGNAQNQIGVFQIGSEADDFEFDEVGSSIVVSPTTTTSSDQDVDQAASASD